MGVKHFSFNSENGTDEFYLAVTPDRVESHFEVQMGDVFSHYLEKMKELCLSEDSAVWANIYLSDCINQEYLLREHPSFIALDSHAAISVVEGKPVGVKLAILVYLIRPCQSINKRSVSMPGSYHTANGVVFGTGSIEHIVIKNMLPSKGQTMKEQANDLFNQVECFLDKMKLPFNRLIRTWIYIRDIDKDYGDMVAERNAFFQKQGLSQSTGFPASTGIEGRSKDPKHLIMMDSLMIKGVAKGQIRRMEALSHMCSTVDYGVTFERGMEVVYGDRRHYYISGTASISPDGRILHGGDVVRQVERTVENISALLESHGAGLKDLAYLVAYIRDSEDEDKVRAALNHILSENLPYLLVAGKVCRPGWLIEIEGTGIIKEGDKGFSPYLMV
ncbi:MAG: RidA family protein [Desulfobacteraceae bacterium]|jgi:enamine deaminase RidA (YjgF/YER057c/UK114 family)